VFETWRANIERAGLREWVSPIPLPSVEAAAQFNDASVDFVFIDADHSYDAVRADIRAWRPKLRAGGLLAGHDYDRAEVRRAVADELGDAVQARPPRSWSIRV